MADSENKINKIDAAIAAAKARKAAREVAEGNETLSAKEPKVRISVEERAAKKEAIIAERALRKAAKSAERESKRGQKLPRQKPAHMSKVARAESKLPTLQPSTLQEYNDIITNFSADQVAALALWLQHYNRAKATERALEAKVQVGDFVTIIGGDPKWLGKSGKVVEARRIRCFVEVSGVTKPVYLFTSDVKMAVEALATGTEG